MNADPRGAQYVLLIWIGQGGINSGEFDGPLFVNGLLCRQDDPKTVHRGIHRLGEIQIFTDGPQEECLLAIAEFLMVRFVFHRDDFVFSDKILVGPDLGVVHFEGVCLGVPVDVGAVRDLFSLVLAAFRLPGDVRDGAFRSHHILHEISRLAHQRAPACLVPTD